MDTSPRVVLGHGVVGPAALVGAVTALAVAGGGTPSGPLFWLSIPAAAVAVAGLLGVYNATMQMNLAANTGAREVRSDLVETTADGGYDTAALALAWGLGTVVCAWVVLLAW